MQTLAEKKYLLNFSPLGIKIKNLRFLILVFLIVLKGTIIIAQTKEDSSKNKLPYPLETDEKNGQFDDKGKSPFYIPTPQSIEPTISFDSNFNKVKIINKLDDEVVGEAEEKSFDDYLNESTKDYVKDYFKQRSQAQTSVIGGGLKPPIDLDLGLLNKLPALVNIRPQGSAELTFEQLFSRVENPTWSLREQRNSQFRFDQNIQVGVVGSIGDKINIGFNYDTEANFDFDNQRKINYVGKEDDIVKILDVGDVTMPIGQSSLITGSTGLFGVKTKLQFGKLEVTGVVSQQNSEKKVISLEGGVQRQRFDIQATEYDVNKHFFLGQFFRDNYNQWQENYPALPALIITRVEVWVTNRQASVSNSRNVVAFMDLGETNYHNQTNINPGNTGNFADNNANSLYSRLLADQRLRNNRDVIQALGEWQSFEQANDYMKVDNARQLQPSEYNVNPYFGFVSLNTNLNADDVVAVAYEYTFNGRRYQVGEFARDFPPDQQINNVLFLKMLKSVNVRTDLPIWDLMMKNIYSLGAFQLDEKDFKMQVVYANDQGNDLNYIPEPQEPTINGNPLVRLLGFDRFNRLMENKFDGLFDFIPNVTVLPQTGQVIFPVLEPFGKDLGTLFQSNTNAQKYIYQAIYDSTIWQAIQRPEFNKFFLRGSYQGGTGNVISLNSLNVRPGSVRVTAGGIPLNEGIDYTVDYSLGRVTILNEGILRSGQIINVESESNNLFQVQQKTLLGTRLDYHVSKDFNLGGTFLYLRERPLTPKVNAGDEPIRNAIGGVDINYKTDSRFLTKLVDRLPFINTKENSSLLLQAEYARVFPGHPKLVNDAQETDGVAYIDDFEGAQVPYDLRLGQNWYLSSTPPSLFPEATSVNSLEYNKNRAHLSWYILDPVFYRPTNLTPANIRNNNTMLSNHYMREVTETEVFPNRQIPNNQINTLPTFDITYYPKERGQYNLSATELNNNGELTNPDKRWAGITRRIETNNFEQQNIEYIEFWLLDPFIYNPDNGGDLYINLGNISEDILKDSRKSWENGLPIDGDPEGVDETTWGRVPNGFQINNAFDNNPESRAFQDVGLDGLSDELERQKFQEYINSVPPSVRGIIENDPSKDNFKYFLDNDYDAAQANIIQRYHSFNGTEGNTPTNITAESGYGTQLPDDEDINRDFTLNELEEYYEYKVSLRRNDLVVGRNYVFDKVEADVQLKNNTRERADWYLFRIPIQEFTGKYGNINDFQSIRFMRMFMTGFTDTVTLRFARLQMMRSTWRRYLGDLESGEQISTDKETRFEMNTVNIEENGNRTPFPYVLPPGIQREIDFSTPNLIQQNEQSLSLKICNLKKGDARGTFKNTNMDLRQYEKLKMFVHGESSETSLQDGQLTVFIRLGADLTLNYYEYEYPLLLTKGNAQDVDAIWPQGNRLELDMSLLYDAKRQQFVIGANSIEVPGPLPGSKIRVKGNPDLGNVRVVMVGLKNPSLTEDVSPCAEVWFNELRATGFNNRGGWASRAVLTSKLADFGRIELSGSRSTIGWGGLEMSLMERQQDDRSQYGLLSSFELGKFFPQKANIRIPMTYSYSQNIITPRFNPLSPDLPLQDLIDSYVEDKNKQDSVRRATQDFTERRGISFTGVQKSRPENTKRKPKFYDIENLTASYSFAEINQRNIEFVYNIEQIYNGQIGYSFPFNPKQYKPFDKLKNKNLKLIKDFNFYLLPQTFATSVQGERKYGEFEYRNTDNVETISEPFYDKSFLLNRNYDLRHNFTKSLRLTYSAQAQSRVEEPFGPVDYSLSDVVLNNQKLNNYQQKTQINYDLPINKIPYLEWINLQTSYSGNYEWITAVPAIIQLGNKIQNSNNQGLTGALTLSTLYNKFKFLRTINQGRSNADEIRKKRLKEKADLAKKDTTFKFDPSKEEPLNGLKALEGGLKILMGLKNVNFNYSVNQGTALPGFIPNPQYIGNDFVSGGPTLGFAFGLQDDIRQQAVQNGWLSTDTNMNSPYIVQDGRSININATVEPLKNMRINIEFNQKRQNQYTELFKSVDGSNFFESLGGVETGSYQTSFLPIRTSFVRNGENNSSPTFNQFENNRIIISERLANENPIVSQLGIDDSTGYYYGYGRYNQDVLLYSFLAAYTGNSAQSSTMTYFPSMPAPNWRFNYSGLSNIEALKKYARTINIQHSYRSSYTVNNYITSLDYDPARVPGNKEDLLPFYQIQQISVQEAFQPLIGIDVNFVNNWTTSIKMNRQRNYSLSFADRRLTEETSEDFVLGIGYRTSKLTLPTFQKRKKIQINNDLTFRLDMSLRDTRGVIRVLDDRSPAPTGVSGQKMFMFSPNINYVFSKSVVGDFYVRRQSITPFTTNQFPNSQTAIGFKLRYILTP